MTEHETNLINYRHTDLGIVGEVLYKKVRNESQLALLICEIGDIFARRRGNNFDRNLWHDYMVKLRSVPLRK